MSKSVFLDIYAGDAELHASQTREYDSLSSFLATNRNTKLSVKHTKLVTQVPPDSARTYANDN
ncbi:hypothetical protein BT69DRAFT_1335151 [Atractiella rhizophila]|nr:hypothetical protein BT69DRAFT_1335151 [Atractiella rhizophila]